MIEEILECLREGTPVRRGLADGGRVHIDRPLSFLCVNASAPDASTAAREIVVANAAYLVAPDLAAHIGLINAVGRAMHERAAAFIVVEIAELERDRLIRGDSPYLPPFETIVTHRDRPAERVALGAFVRAMDAVEPRYRSARVEAEPWPEAADDWTGGLDPGLARMRIRFAPIYLQPETGRVYPELRRRVVTNLLDAVLQAVAAYLRETGVLRPATHRALGRRVFVDAVRRVDARIDRVAGAFDFLLAVTPINAEAARAAFEAGRRERAPRFLYRPLTIDVDREKRRLYAIPYDNLEDPSLHDLYREKRQELDLQLTLLSARDTSRFSELSRALYGPVEPDLLAAARRLLGETASAADRAGADPEDLPVDAASLAVEARRMIRAYRAAGMPFAARVELRDDIPPGMMVSGPRLLIASGTRMRRRRVEALLSHEIGVHLFTYFAGDAQGLRLFRSGLAGYEGMQEGLAVLAEYLAGGMTPGRLRLIAARVVGCAAMLDGAEFGETFALLSREHGFPDAGAFGIALRLYRSGGLAKDAVYLRGLLSVLGHLRGGRSLEPFWMGKASAEHFGIMAELHARGLLRPPPAWPAFLAHPGAERRLAAARTGMSVVDLLSI